MATVVIADDHAIVRKGLRTVLEGETGFTIVGEAEDGRAAVELVNSLQPDIAIVDVMMPGLGGLEVTRLIHQRLPRTHIVVLSMHDNEPYVLEALRNGASAYLIKASSIDNIIVALETVMSGRRYLSPPLTERAILAYMQRTHASQETAIDRYELLTSREREVLHLAAEGKTNMEIGQRLNISPRTAETHRTNLMRKIGLHNQAELIKYALQQGIITVE